MSTGWVTVWSGRDWVEMPVAAMKGETLVVPNIAANRPIDSPGEAGRAERRLDHRLDGIGRGHPRSADRHYG